MRNATNYLQVAALTTLWGLISGCGWEDAPPSDNQINQSQCVHITDPAWNNVVHSYSPPTRLNYCPLLVPAFRELAGAMIIDVNQPRSGQIGHNFTGHTELWEKNLNGLNGLVNQKAEDKDISFSAYQPVVVEGTYVSRANFNLTWGAGRGSYPGTTELDSLYVQIPVFFQSGGDNLAQLAIVTPVEVTDRPGSVTGPSSLSAGSGGTWNVRTHWDVFGYRFKWYVDGVLSPGDTWWSMTRSFPTKGTKQLRVDQYLADNTVLSSYFNVSVSPYAYISGPSEIPSNAYNTWYANPTGGTAPYSYQWYRDGSPVSTSSSYEASLSAGQYSLELFVTDNDGAQAPGVQHWVYVSSCSQLPCEEWRVVRPRAKRPPRKP